jgi:hypothetical protein
MINERAVSQALLTQLKTVIGLPHLVVDGGTAYTPSPTVAYCKEYDLSGDTFGQTVTNDGVQRKDGIYQVDVFTPKNSGKWAGLETCALIQTAFARGVVLTNDSQKVKIKDASRSPVRYDNTHQIISISVGYTALS